MSRMQRIVLLAIAVLVVVVALIVVGVGGRTEKAEVTTVAPAATAGVTSGTQTMTATTATTATTRTTAEPPPPLLRAGRTLRFKKGEMIRFRFRNEAADELHIHGYDRTYELRAGVTKTIAFKATIDGIFEVELHHSGAPAGRLRVDP